MNKAIFVATVDELVNSPHESLDVELKEWLDLANDAEHRGGLAKAIIAIANHGGGYVLLGFDDAGAPAAGRPAIMTAYEQDEINNVVRRFCEPSFHVSVHFARRIEDGLEYPVVVVPGGHKVPIRSRSETPARTIVNNTYYIRRLGPSSALPENGREWDQLIERCIRNRRDELTDVLRDVLAGRAPERETQKTDTDLHMDWFDSCVRAWHASLGRHAISEGEYQWMPDGHWTFSYSVLGDFPHLDPNELRDVLREVYRQITGWPVFMWLSRDDVRPAHREPGIIECHIATHVGSADSAHSDYWRASVDGRIFLRRGYQEDSGLQGIPQATVFDYLLPIWRTGEALLHANRFADMIGGSRVLVVARWTGLKGRRLAVIPSPDRLYLEPVESGTSVQDLIDSHIELDANRISASLPEILHEFLTPLYSAFDFAEAPSIDVIATEIDRMVRKHGAA